MQGPLTAKFGGPIWHIPRHLAKPLRPLFNSRPLIEKGPPFNPPFSEAHPAEILELIHPCFNFTIK